MQELNKTHVLTCTADDLPAVVQADAGSLDQVFTNLISNAVKYSPESPNIEIEAYTEHGHAVVRVKDQGFGIDAEDLPKMFTRFFRARNSTGIAGTGIGLNLVQTLVELHDGRVSVDSRKGVGSTFTVYLPIGGPKVTQQATGVAA